MKNFMYLLALTACLSLNVYAEDTSLDDENEEILDLLSDDEASDTSDDEEAS